ncbi:MAG: nitroreductase [Pseudomonadota bacterium]
MELRDYLATRRSHPASEMAAPGPDAATIDAMLTIASRVPDHGKLAPWRFILFEGDARAAAGAAIAALRPDQPERLAEADRSRFTRAPLVVGVVSTAAPHAKIPQWEQELAVGAVCMNLIHAANAHGFVAQWLSEWPTYDADAGRALGLEEGERFAGFVYVGTGTRELTDRVRPDVPSLVTHFAA